MGMEELKSLIVNSASGQTYEEAEDYFKDRFIGQVGIVVANGPSLSQVPNSFLDTFATFGCNRIYLREGFTPQFFVQLGRNQINDQEKANRFRPIIEEVEAAFINRLAVPEFFSDLENVYGILSRPLSAPEGAGGIGPAFSLSPLDAIGVTRSIIYISLQLAYWMGFETVLIVGLDHEYPKDWETPFHFYPNHPDVTSPEPAGGNENFKSESDAAFRNARAQYEKDGRRIINLTPGSKCDVFEFGELEEWV